MSGLLRRVRTRFQVAAAEVGDRDRWQVAEVAVVCVSAEGKHADEVLAHVLAYLESSQEAQVTNVKTELLRV